MESNASEVQFFCFKQDMRKRNVEIVAYPPVPPIWTSLIQKKNERDRRLQVMKTNTKNSQYQLYLLPFQTIDKVMLFGARS